MKEQEVSPSMPIPAHRCFTDRSRLHTGGSLDELKAELAAGAHTTPPHGLHPDTMALITSVCDAMRSLAAGKPLVVHTIMRAKM